MNDQKLVARILAGDEEARDDLYRSYRKRIYVTAAHFLGISDPDLEDVVQDTFVSAYARLEGFQNRSGLYTWLNHICVNRCLDLIRKRKRTVLVDEEKFYGWFENLRAPAGEAPDEPVIQAEHRALLMEHIPRLGDKCRELLKLRIGEELPFAVIAKKLGMGMGGITARMVRCRRALEQSIRDSFKNGKSNG